MSDSSTIPSTRTALGRLGLAGHYRDSDPEKFAGVQRDYRAVKVRDAIQKAIDTAPPLTPAQVDALSELLATARNQAEVA